MSVTRRHAVAKSATLVALLAILTLVSQLGHWLAVQDPLLPATAIVVLNGETPARVQEAISLYRQRWAPEIWLTQLPDLEALAQRIRDGDIVDSGTRFNLKLLREADVPENAVRVLREPIWSTAQELRAVAAQARGGPLIVVTSALHTRRARFLWDRAVRTPAIVVRHPHDSQWDLARWWRREETRRAVVHEIVGLIAAYVTEPRPRAPRMRD